MDRSLNPHQSNGVGSGNGNGSGNGHGILVNGALFVNGGTFGRSWAAILQSLQHVLRNQSYSASPFRTVSWDTLPRALAERGLFLQGVPTICAPVVRGDHVQDELSKWSREKLNALDTALKNRTLKVLPREPVSQPIIFQFVNEHGAKRDSCLGFSPKWQFIHMFPEHMYHVYTMPVLRTMNLAGFFPVLENIKVSPNQFPWVSLPAKLWSSEYYLSGLPRICLPPVINDKIPPETPSPATRWRKEQRVALQRALDAGILKLVKRPPGRDVIFEVLETDGSLNDEDCGFSGQWKAIVGAPPPPKIKPKKPQARHSIDKPVLPTPISPVVWQHPTDGFSKKLAVLERYATLLGKHGLLMDAPDGPAWVYVPQMLATKRLYISGLPRVCLPRINDDDVIANYDPRQWNTTAQDQFLEAIERDQIQVNSRLPGQRVLYKVIDESGGAIWETLGFSEKWCVSNLDFVDLANPRLLPPLYVIEMWLAMLESMGIPCHDHRGRRRIQWVQLPMHLAHRRLYISGCPVECMPKVSEDIVDELSSPYFYRTDQVLLMRQAFQAGRVVMRPRGSARNVIFTGEVDNTVQDLTCGFSHGWVQLNLHVVPNSMPLRMFNIPKGPASLPHHPSTPSSASHSRRQSMGERLERLPSQTSDLPTSQTPEASAQQPPDSSISEISTSQHIDHPARRPLYITIRNGHTSHPPEVNSPRIPHLPDTPTPSTSSRSIHSATPPLTRPSSVRPAGPHERSTSLTIIIPAFKRRRHISSSSLSRADTSMTSIDSMETETENMQITKVGEGASRLRPLRPIAPHSQSEPMLPKTKSSVSVIPQPQAIVPYPSHPPQSLHPVPMEESPKRSTVPTSPSRPIIPLRRKPAPPAPPTPPAPPVPLPSTTQRHALQSRRSVIKIPPPHTRSATALRRSTDHPPRQPSPVVSEDEEDEQDRPGSFGNRTIMSPPLPPRSTLPDVMPPTPLPTFLPIPGGNLAWDEERLVWELTISEIWPPDSWKKQLPFFPARIFWNAAQKVWMCEPSECLRRPDTAKTILTPAVLASLTSARSNGPLPTIEPGLSVIWHRWRRTWGLFEYALPSKPSTPH